MSSCLSESDLHRLLAREMDEAETQRARDHLAACAACAQRNAELQDRHEQILLHLENLSGPFMETVPLGGAAEQETESADTAGGARPPSIAGYTVIRELHRGGQGVVFLALQQSTKRKVAIKILLEGPYASAAAQRRFIREVELAASLKHPHIVSIHASGAAETGQPYYVMDYVRGLPFREHVRSQALSLEETLHLFQKVCDAVNHAHQRGIIHRDLKPSNVLIDADGEPRILDFGLAKSLGTAEQSLLSVTGQLVGTLPYMSPEQVRGNPDEVDVRTDVYALGVMLYEVLTGCYPYPVVGQMADVLRNISEAQPVPPSKQWRRDSGIASRARRRSRAGKCPIDQELQTVVLKTLAKERGRRYQSAGELARDIQNYLTGRPVAAQPDSAWYVLRKLAARNAAASIGLLSVFVAMVSFAAISFHWYQREQDIARELRETNRAVAQRNRELEQIVADARRFLHAQAFGWFLLEWQEDRLERAHEIHRSVAQVAPDEARVMQFLLDDSVTLETLLAELPESAQALAHFAAGERARKAGRDGEAAASFETALRIAQWNMPGAGDDTWLSRALHARLRQVGNEASPEPATDGHDGGRP